MNIIEAIGLIGGAASIAGLLYAFYFARKSYRRKEFVYTTSWAAAIASAESPVKDYQLSLRLQRRNGVEETIKSAYVSFVLFANIGKEPIRREDLAPANPLSLEMEAARVLDISLATVTRPVTNVAISNITVGEARGKAQVTFDFLDENDGAVVQILTEGQPQSIRIAGTIIGMPDGIKKFDELPRRSFWSTLGICLSILFLLSAIVLCPFAFRWITGSWEHAYLMVLPLVALVVPLVIIGVIAATIWPEGGRHLPVSLPEWFLRPYPAHMIMDSRIDSRMSHTMPPVPEKEEEKSG